MLAFATGFCDFSIALAALVIAPSSADEFLAAAGEGTLVPVGGVSVFGAAAPGVSAPIERIFIGGGPEAGAGFGADAVTAVFESVADGLLAIMGTFCCWGCCCCWDAKPEL